MEVSPISLEGASVRLEPLSRTHRDVLFAAAADGELWNSTVTVIPASPEAAAAYIEEALSRQAEGRELPFVIIRKSSSRVVGTTRYRAIEPVHRRLEVGSTWLSASAQRSAVNTEAKLLLLSHAFEVLGCVRIEFLTDVLNEPSRGAILRLGAKLEGILRSHMIMSDGRRRDSACYSIVQPEWLDVKSRLETKLRLYQLVE